MNAWSPGLLDIHHINTGLGDATLFILPDGTTMLLDAGDLNPPSLDSAGVDFAEPRPNPTRRPGEWISRYIHQALAHDHEAVLDYVVITHFHGDHMGSISDRDRASGSGAFQLTGITEVGERIPSRRILDRGWPDYAYPAPLADGTMRNYRAFVRWQAENRGSVVERFAPGRCDQITMVRDPGSWDHFEIRNVAANGVVWTGVGTRTRKHFPTIENADPGSRPPENLCSIAMRVSYGRFNYFTGGDIQGIVQPGEPAWYDVETPVARVVGPVDVNVVNHHGYFSSESEFFLASLQPRVHILSIWCHDQPDTKLLRRLLSTRLYAGPRDVFATNLVPARRGALGPLVDEFGSTQGHILVRVDPGGNRYRVMVLDDSQESYAVTATHGPYISR